MKRIFKLSIVIVFAVIIASCTDEADVLDNTPIKNKKTLTQPTIERPHPEYEEIDMSSEAVIQLVSDFNNAMIGEIEIPSMDIKNALLAMETFFNYGVVAKQEIEDTTAYYTGSNFQFEINIDDQGNINVDELVEVYKKMDPSDVGNILESMMGNNKTVTKFEVDSTPVFEISDSTIVLDVLGKMKKSAVSEILGSMSAKNAAELTQMLAKP